MRLPLVSELDSRDGESNKDARLTNVLKETDEGGDLACVRPGLEAAAIVAGDGGGLVCFNGDLISIFEDNIYQYSGGLGSQPTLAGTPESTVFNKCSANGGVIVGSDYATYETNVPIKWTQSDGVVELSDKRGESNGVSSNGSVIVGTVNISPNTTVYNAFRWTQATGMVILGTLPTGNISYGVGVSGDGNVVVGKANATVAYSNYRGFSWTPSGGMVNLGTLGGDVSEAYACSYDGSVIVGYSKTSLLNANYVAVKWDNGVISDLGMGNLSVAYYCSSDGSVIIGRMESGGVYRAIRWENGQIYMIDGFPAGASSEATWCSNDGNVIIGNVIIDYISYGFMYGNGRLFILDPDSTLRGGSSDGNYLVGSVGDDATFIPQFKSIATIQSDTYDFAQSPL